MWRGAGLTALGGAALIAVPTALAPLRWRRWIGAATTVAVSGLVLADLLHLRWFGTLVPVAAVLAWRQVGRVEGSVAALLEPIDGLLLPVAVAAAVGAVLWPAPGRPSLTWRRTRWLAITAVLVAVMAPATLAVTMLSRALADPVLAEQVFSQPALVERWGVLNTHLFDAMRELREALAAEPLSDERRRAVDVFFATRAARPDTAGAWAGAARGRNLILVQVESLQEWVVHARVSGTPVMPFLDGARSRGLYFPLVFDQTAHGRSSDAEFIALNSLPALERGAVAFRRPDNHFVTLSKVLREAG